MRKAAEWALAGFAALMAVAWPAPPLPGHSAWADVVMLFCALAFGAAVLFERERSLSTVGGALWVALGYLGWVARSASAHHAGGWKVLGVAELVCVLAIAAALTRDDRVRDRVVRAWIFGAAALSAIGLVVALLATCGLAMGPLLVGSGELGLTLRPAGLTSTGLLAEVALVPLLVLYTDGDRLVGKRARRALFTLLAVTLVASATRTLLAALAGLLLVELLRGRSGSPRPHARVLVTPRRALVGLCALVLISLASVRIDIHRSGAPGIRWRIAASALATARANPLYGVGPTAEPARAAWPGPHDLVMSWDSHNTVLDLAATLGLPGLVAFALLVALLILRARKAELTPLAIALTAALYATLFDAGTVDVEDFRHVWLLFGLIGGLATARARCGPAGRRAPSPPEPTAPSPNGRTA